MALYGIQLCVAPPYMDMGTLEAISVVQHNEGGVCEAMSGDQTSTSRVPNSAHYRYNSTKHRTNRGRNMKEATSEQINASVI